MVATCIVSGCPTNSLRFRQQQEKEGRSFSSYRLPSSRDPIGRRTWLEACGRLDLLHKDKGDLRVCARHFEGGVRRDMPTIGLPGKPRTEGDAEQTSDAAAPPSGGDQGGPSNASASVPSALSGVASGRVEKRKASSAPISSRGMVDVLATAAAQARPLHDPRGQPAPCNGERCRVELDKLRVTLAREIEQRMADRQEAVAAVGKAMATQTSLQQANALLVAEVSRLKDANARLAADLEDLRAAKEAQAAYNRNDMRRLSEAMDSLRSELRTRSRKPVA